MSAARWMPVASPNWLAMMLASVSPGPRMFALIVLRAPDDQRHRDRLADGPAETDHDRRTTPAAAVREHRAADHLPPRRAQRDAASFSDAGVVANTSRVIEVTIGVIMMATTIPAVMKLGPAARVGEQVAEDRDAGEVAVEMLE